MKLWVKTTAGRKPELDPAVHDASAAINEVVGARDYGGENIHSVTVRLLPKEPRGGFGVKRGYPGSFAEYLQLDGLLPSPLNAQAIVAAVAQTLNTNALFGVDLLRLSRDVLAARRRLPLRRSAEQIWEENQVRFVLGDEKRRRRLKRPLVRALEGIRTYCTNDCETLLAGEEGVLGTVLCNLLIREKLKTPGYQEIYFNIAGSLDDARRQSAAVEDWHENAYAVIDLDQYKKSTQTQKEQLLIDALGTGLLRLAAVDGLDKKSIQRVLTRLRKDGWNTDLWGPSAENDSYRAQVLFRHEPGDRCAARFRLVVTNKQSGKTKTHQLGRYSVWAWPVRFAKVSLTRSCVRVDTAKGDRADAQLKKTPRRLEFRLE